MRRLDFSIHQTKWNHSYTASKVPNSSRVSSTLKPLQLVAVFSFSTLSVVQFGRTIYRFNPRGAKPGTSYGEPMKSGGRPPRSPCIGTTSTAPLVGVLHLLGMAHKRRTFYHNGGRRKFMEKSSTVSWPDFSIL